ncbi:MAG TPA: fatty acid desaturase, partial [Verrucomicrobium sp.]|nr:fatty acid desaturase [Verrucomicrobium sp.]
PVVALVIGARIQALGLLVHDATHRVAFKTKWLNELLGETLVAWPLFIVIEKGYRTWHFDHHRHLGTDHDPELDSYRSDSPYDKPVTWRRVWRYFATDLLGLGVYDLFKFLKAIFPYKQPWRILGPVGLYAAFFAVCYFSNSLWVFYLWVWSIITGFWAVFRIRTWTEHVGVEPQGKETSHRFSPGWDPHSPGVLGKFLFFPHNTYCHYEHHKYPQVPYYHLPALRKLEESRPVSALGELFPAT